MPIPFAIIPLMLAVAALSQKGKTGAPNKGVTAPGGDPALNGYEQGGGGKQDMLSKLMGGAAKMPSGVSSGDPSPEVMDMLTKNGAQPTMGNINRASDVVAADAKSSGTGMVKPTAKPPVPDTVGGDTDGAVPGDNDADDVVGAMKNDPGIDQTQGPLKGIGAKIGDFLGMGSETPASKRQRTDPQGAQGPSDLMGAVQSLLGQHQQGTELMTDLAQGTEPAPAAPAQAAGDPIAAVKALVDENKGAVADAKLAPSFAGQPDYSRQRQQQNGAKRRARLKNAQEKVNAR